MLTRCRGRAAAARFDSHCTKSGSLALPAAIRRAASRVNNLAIDNGPRRREVSAFRHRLFLTTMCGRVIQSTGALRYGMVEGAWILRDS
jgi:hypothetical protein